MSGAWGRGQPPAVGARVLVCVPAPLRVWTSLTLRNVGSRWSLWALSVAMCLDLALVWQEWPVEGTSCLPQLAEERAAQVCPSGHGS